MVLEIKLCTLLYLVFISQSAAFQPRINHLKYLITLMNIHRVKLILSIGLCRLLSLDWYHKWINVRPPLEIRKRNRRSWVRASSGRSCMNTAGEPRTRMKRPSRYRSSSLIVIINILTG